VPRANYDATMAAAIATGQWMPICLASFAFKSQTANCWSGPGSLVWNGMTFLGIGSLGKIGSFGGGDGSVVADGASVSLSGIDATLLGETLADIQIGGAATLWLGAWADGAIVGTPYPLFAGGVDQPVIMPGTETFDIALRLETRMKQLARATCRRYTAADQRFYYPDDTAFNYVELQNDIALLWG